MMSRQIRRVMRMALSSQGYTIVEARNAQEALKEVRAEHIDLVLLDMNMPDMDGMEVCREIRTASKVPVIMVTVALRGKRQSTRSRRRRRRLCRETLWH